MPALKDFDMSSINYEKGGPRFCNVCGILMGSHNISDRCNRHGAYEPAYYCNGQLLPPDQPLAPSLLTEATLRDIVLATFGVSYSDLVSRGQDRIVVRARHVLAYLLRVDFKLTFPETLLYIGTLKKGALKEAFRRLHENRNLAMLIAQIRAQYPRKEVCVR